MYRMIAFWPAASEKDNAAIMAMTAVLGSLKYHKKIMLLENYLNERNLGHHLLGERYTHFRTEYEQYHPSNYERGEVFLKYVGKQTEKKVRYQKSLEIIRDYLYFTPLDQSQHKVVYEYGFDQDLQEVLEDGLQSCEYVWINVERRNNLSTKYILDAAEEVIIPIHADKQSFERFYEEYKGIVSKAFFVFYGRSEKGFLRKMKNRYSFLEKQAIQIEVTTEMRAYWEEGKTIEYMCIYCNADRESTEYTGVRRLKELTMEILSGEWVKKKNQRQEEQRYRYRSSAPDNRAVAEEMNYQI